MATPLLSHKAFDDGNRSARGELSPQVDIEIGLLTGGIDKHYALGLATALVSKGARIDVIGSDDVDSPELHVTPTLRFFNLRGTLQRNATLARKVWRVLAYYFRLIHYAAYAKPKLFHILWNNKFQFFDRTLLMLYYRLLGKKIVLTAHNVNAGKRDSNDSALNRLTLRIQYRLSDHIFVHTEIMKRELLESFGVPEQSISIIPYGINDCVPDTDLSQTDAKKRLGIRSTDKTILFFGNIGPYKGLEFLVAAFDRIAAQNANYRLIIAGKPRGDCEEYVVEIRRAIDRSPGAERIIQHIEYVRDEDTEVYFKAADLLVLPYRDIYQSGVLFLGYNFGLPVVATDVGSLRVDIIEGRTGFLCKPCDAVHLAKIIEVYFESDLFKNLRSRRQEIRAYATAKHSWNTVGNLTRNVYAGLLLKH